MKENEDVKFYNGAFMLGDCLERMREIPTGSVDMILCDLPYGTTQNKWDAVIPFEPLWAEYWRVAKPNAAVVLTAAQPFTSALVMSQLRAFRYDWVWEKPKASGFLNARRRPLACHESVLVFSDTETPYRPQGLTAVSVNSARKNKSGNGNFGKVSAAPYVQKEGNFPRSVLNIQHETKPFHPTQKPVALFEYLIRTYTDESMTVLDSCAGSGTTAIAAERSNRRWICIERDPEYFAKAVERVRNEVASKGLFA